MSHSHSQLRDPAIKLFGRNIPFPDSNISATLESMDECTEATKSKVDDSVEKPHELESDGKLNNTYQENEAEASQNSGEEKALKKPEKLVPCPRCNSLETKFCYFNNYNVNQPRHFCKGCHRYWTAGGTIRNVPVGAGRRRNTKHSSSSSSSQTRQTIETNPDTSLSDENGNNNSNNNNNNSPLCESMEAKLSLEDSKRAEPGPSSEEPLSSSSCSSPFPQWPCWSPGWSSVPVMTVPGFCPPNVPFQFVPGSYWGYVPGWEGSGSNSGSPTLGKHSRESSAKCLWVPKTLRSDDPNEAAKSSIWSTLGIEPDRNEGLVRSGIFKPFKRRSDTDSGGSESGQVLQSNPAALSRSHSFQEST